MKGLTNAEAARVFYNIAALLEMKGENRFKIQAYSRAARSIELLPVSIEEVYRKKGLRGISGVGEHIALKIEELLKTGKLGFYEKLKKKIPVRIEELNGVAGLGPKRILKLYKELGVKDLNDLKRVANLGKIRKLKGFGAKVERNILGEIGHAKQGEKRFALSEVKPLAEKIKKEIAKMNSVKRVDIAGSYRRKQATIRDIDIMMITTKAEEVINHISRMKEIEKVLAKGKKKLMVRLKSGIDMDVRVFSEGEYGAALQYNTGNKEHNITLRKIALKKGYTLNEYGLFTLKGKKKVAGESEKEIYNILGFKWIPPEERINAGEFDKYKLR
jgi:DNA polymerase (family 10)